MWAHSETGIITTIKKIFLIEQLLTLDFKDINYLSYNVFKRAVKVTYLILQMKC